MWGPFRTCGVLKRCGELLENNTKLSKRPDPCTTFPFQFKKKLIIEYHIALIIAANTGFDYDLIIPRCYANNIFTETTRFCKYSITSLVHLQHEMQ
jgi:hypothetical protein